MARRSNLDNAGMSPLRRASDVLHPPGNRMLEGAFRNSDDVLTIEGACPAESHNMDSSEQKSRIFFLVHQWFSGQL